MEFLIVSGLSGAGKGRVKSLLDDFGYFPVDNMPPELWEDLAKLFWQDENRPRRVALVVDVRSGTSFDPLFAAMRKLTDMNCVVRLLFVEAEERYIQRRYQETRRRHPLQNSDMSLSDAMAYERVLLAPVRVAASLVLDATGLSAARLREKMAELLSDDTAARTALPIVIYTFGYKNGLPADADLVFDVRFLPNPFYVPELRPLSGLDAPVRDYVMKFPESADFLARLYDMLAYLFPLFRREGKSGLTIAVGCTGGKHRSVTIACELGRHLESGGHSVTMIHRDIHHNA